MLILTVLSAALSLSQVGVLGGVPALQSSPKNTRGVGGHNASLLVTPSNLRVVENSGVCGQFFSSCIQQLEKLI